MADQTPEPTSSNGPGEGTPASATGADDSALGEAGIKALQTEREARKAAERRASQAEEKVKQFETAGMTETQKVTAERDDYKAKWEQLTSQVAERDARAALTTAATKAGATAPGAVAQLADLAMYRDKGADQAVAALRTTYPDLFRPAGKADSGAGKGGNPPSFSDVVRKALIG